MSEIGDTYIEHLLREFPEWRAFLRVEKAEDGSEFHVVEVAPPETANVEHGLVIDTSNNEVTIGFDFYHSHFDQWVGDGDYFGARAALEFVKKIIEERVCVVSWWQNDQWRGSSHAEANGQPEIPPLVDPAKFNRIRIRSWRGTFNADSYA